jgi:hypothetical protein
MDVGASKQNKSNNGEGYLDGTISTLNPIAVRILIVTFLDNMGLLSWGFFDGPILTKPPKLLTKNDFGIVDIRNCCANLFWTGEPYVY